MELIRDFKHISKGDAALAGGKGASLGEMTQAGIPVPPGFVVLSAAFERFLEETDLRAEIDAQLARVDTEKMHTVEDASAKIQELIRTAQTPEDIKTIILSNFKELDSQFVAVRSSATAEDSASAAWAGQLDSYLNTTEDSLLLNVQRCWASLFTPRAIFYRFEKDLHQTHISVAVVVQKMVESEVSGIAFSVHPVTEDYNQLIIEAGFGLGEAIVSGQVTPDSYVVEKEPRRIIDTNVATQTRALYRKDAGGNEWKDIPEPKASSQVLTESKVLELSELVVRIEKHYGFPCDIEWAHEAGRFYIVQSRPITTLALVQSLTTTQENFTAVILKEKWFHDWGGPFGLLDVSLAPEVYFNEMQSVFGKALSMFLVTYKNGLASAYLPQREYEALGEYLANKAGDVAYAISWAESFKQAADSVSSYLELSPEQYLLKLSELTPRYRRYGVYNVATKIAFTFLLPGTPEIVKESLEEARRYSESFYKDNAVMLGKVAAHIVSLHPVYNEAQIGMMTRAELFAYVERGFLPSVEELQSRLGNIAVFFDTTGEHFVSSDELNRIESIWLAKLSSDTLEGVSAYPGIVTGRCRIVGDYKGVVLDPGEILVTRMTDPHFLSLMKAAGAIVTDGGGMLSHAAIVSRELRKPTVIGTNVATQVLKDGDLVEVDADSGVVKILKRA